MWAVASLSAMVTFAGLYFGPIRNQRVEGLLNEWGPKFPDFQSPASLPWWLIETTTTVFQFCYNPIGFYLAVVAPFGIVSAWRSGRRDLVVLLTAPFALAVVAAALKAYPYGFNRLMFFIAPCALLLGGLGMDAIFRYLPSKRLHIATGALLLAIGSLLPALHVVKPWDRPDSSGMAAYIRAHRLEGDRVAADEQTYAYFFRGELLSLNEAAATIPPGGRVWVPMDFYTPDVRIAYLESKLKPGEFELIGEWRFRDCCAYLFVRRR